MNKIGLKTFSRFAIVLILAYLVVWIGGTSLNTLRGSMLGSDELYKLSLNAQFIQIVQNIISILINLIVAIWLYLNAKRSGRTAIVWFLFGLAFGIIAPILYFVIPDDLA